MGEGQGWGCFPDSAGRSARGASRDFFFADSGHTPIPTLPPSRGKGFIFSPLLPRLLTVLAAVACLAAASDPAERLHDPAREARARTLFRQIRCVQCQSESIDDSEAPIAHDLRGIVREQVSQGRTDGQIKHYLVDRYGEFVLLRPSFSWVNTLLWLTPLFAVGAAGAVLVVQARKSRPEVEPPLSAEEEARLAALTMTGARDSNSSHAFASSPPHEKA
jgi:cytochrome c-type biogenesis protein CcmH